MDYDRYFNPKSIGITGSTGFLGANMILSLLQTKSNKINSKSFLSNIFSQENRLNLTEIRAFYSSTRWNPLLFDVDDPSVSFQHLNILDYEQCLEKTKGLDCIVHFAGMVSFSKKDKLKLWEINVEGSKNLLKAAIENKVRRFILVSSIAILTVDENSSDKNAKNPRARDRKVILDEKNITEDKEKYLDYDLQYAKSNFSFLKKIKYPYNETKLAAFLICKQIAKHSDIDFLTILPGTVLGAGDNHFSITKFVDNIYNNKLFFSLSGNTSYVHAQDLTKGVLLAMIKGKNLEDYIISGNERDNITYKDFMVRIANYIKKTYKKKIFSSFISIPGIFARSVSYIIEKIAPGTSIPYGMILSAIHKEYFSIEKAKTELGYDPEYSIEDGIRDLVDFYINFKIGEHRRNYKYFKIIKKVVADPWVKSHGQIIVSGKENIVESPRKVYIVNHPTTFDMFTLIHICKNCFYVPVDKEAFDVPIAGYFMRKAGFIPVINEEKKNYRGKKKEIKETDNKDYESVKIEKTKNRTIIEKILEYARLGYPCLNSIRGGDVTLGKPERLRTGGVVMADLAKADIIPIHIYIEKGKIIQKKILTGKLQFAPFTIYKNAYVILSFLPPIKWKDYHKESMTKQDYQNLINKVDEEFNNYSKELNEKIHIDEQGYYKGLKRNKGCDISIEF